MSFVKQAIVASVVLVAIASLSGLPRDSSLGQDVNGRKLSDNLDNLANQVADNRDIVGSRLLAILADEQASTMDRLRAADRLGKLQYLPAIPTLVQYVDLEPEVISSGGSRVEITSALGRCGNAAIPALVQEYLRLGITSTYPARGRQRAILRAIQAGDNTAETAMIYARGIAAEGNAAMQERVTWFIEELESHQENRPPKHKPLKHNKQDETDKEHGNTTAKGKNDPNGARLHLPDIGSPEWIQEANTLCSKRTAIIKAFMQVLQNNSHGFSCLKAAEVLGDYRAVEATSLLVDRIDIASPIWFSDHPLNQHAAAMALVEIGQPSYNAIIARLDDDKEVSDHELRLFAFVIMFIDGREVGLFRLNNTLEFLNPKNDELKSKNLTRLIEIYESIDIRDPDDWPRPRG